MHAEQGLEQHRPEDEPEAQDRLVEGEPLPVAQPDRHAHDEVRQDGEDDEEVVQEEGVDRLLHLLHVLLRLRLGNPGRRDLLSLFQQRRVLRQALDVLGHLGLEVERGLAHHRIVVGSGGGAHSCARRGRARGQRGPLDRDPSDGGRGSEPAVTPHRAAPCALRDPDARGRDAMEHGCRRHRLSLGCFPGRRAPCNATPPYPKRVSR